MCLIISGSEITIILKNPCYFYFKSKLVRQKKNFCISSILDKDKKQNKTAVLQRQHLLPFEGIQSQGDWQLRPKHRALRKHQSGDVRPNKVLSPFVTYSQNQELPPFQSHKKTVNMSNINSQLTVWIKGQTKTARSVLEKLM